MTYRILSLLTFVCLLSFAGTDLHFENTTENWKLKKATTLVKSENGEALIQVDYPAEEVVSTWYGDSYGAESVKMLPVPPLEQNYTLSAQARGQGTLWLHLWCYDAKENYVGDFTTAPQKRDFFVYDPKKWKQVNIRGLRFPKGTVFYKVILEIGAPDVDIHLQIRNVCLKDEQTHLQTAGKSSLEVEVVPAITDKFVLPDTEVKNSPSPLLKITAAPDEYEAASFAFRCHTEMPALNFQAGDLASPDGKKTISATNLDLRYVKCWYTGGRNSTTRLRRFRILCPELLVKDDSIIRADEETRQNYAKLVFPYGTYYTCISDPLGDALGRDIGETRCLTNKEFPFQDSTILQPLDLPQDTTRQLWLTFHAPNDAAAGVYRGVIRAFNDKTPLRDIPIEVTILPFRLEKTPMVLSLYYKGSLGGEGTISAGNFAHSKNETQYRAEMRNLKEHGYNPPIFFVGWNSTKMDLEELRRTLQIRKETGLDNTTLYIWGSGPGNSQDAKKLETMKGRAKAIMELCRSFGAKEIYFYGIDEATGEKLKSQRVAWQAIHDIGGKIYVAGYKGNENLMVMGDLLDLFVKANKLDPDEAKAWHAKGHKIFSYANPQGGVERPQLYRCNYGLLLWQAGYDGGMTHAYQCCYGNAYNDFDGDWRDENMAYPTTNGVIDTIEWEGMREGADDLRYLATLQKAMENSTKLDAVAKAKAFLKKLQKEDLYKKLDQVRNDMIQLILELQ